jgi:DNA-binding NarL/FixJ family response regulator
MPESDPPILALVRDLMFSGRIMAEARAAGANVHIVRDPKSLEGATDTQASLMIVDLNLPGAIEAAADWQKKGPRRVVGFVSHEDAQTISQARSAGIDQVLARSRFVQILPQLLTQK